MSKQISVRIPDKTYARLMALSAKTGRTAKIYILEALEEHLQ